MNETMTSLVCKMFAFGSPLWNTHLLKTAYKMVFTTYPFTGNAIVDAFCNYVVVDGTVGTVTAIAAQYFIEYITGFALHGKCLSFVEATRRVKNTPKRYYDILMQTLSFFFQRDITQIVENSQEYRELLASMKYVRARRVNVEQCKKWTESNERDIEMYKARVKEVHIALYHFANLTYNPSEVPAECKTLHEDYRKFEDVSTQTTTQCYLQSTTTLQLSTIWRLTSFLFFPKNLARYCNRYQTLLAERDALCRNYEAIYEKWHYSKEEAMHWADAFHNADPESVVEMGEIRF